MYYVLRTVLALKGCQQELNLFLTEGKLNVWPEKTSLITGVVQAFQHSVRYISLWLQSAQLNLNNHVI